MVLDKKCPGARSLRQPVPAFINCPDCGTEIEIWTDELRATCPKCGKRVFREQQPSCIDWCSYAKECVGPEVYQRMKQTEAGNSTDAVIATPLDILRREHERALQQLNVLQAATLCLRVSASAAQSPVRDNGINNLNKVIDFIDKEMRLHFQREEEVLFPAIEKHIGVEKSPTQLLLKEHARLWELYAELKSKLAEFQKNGSAQPVTVDIYEIARQMIGLLRGHIEKENATLLPLAEGLLAESEMAGIAQTPAR